MRLELTFAEWMGLLTTVGILATFGLSLYVWLRHTRPSQEVRVDVIGPGGEAMRVSFINKRGPGVVIEEVGFEFGDGSDIVIERMYAWDEVLPGRRLVCHYSFEGLQGEEAPVKIFFRDATGQKYTTSLSPYIRSALVGE